MPSRRLPPSLGVSTLGLIRVYNHSRSDYCAEAKKQTATTRKTQKTMSELDDHGPKLMAQLVPLADVTTTWYPMLDRDEIGPIEPACDI